MKLKKVLVFSELPLLMPELCSGASHLAEQSVAVVLGSKEEALSLTQFATEVLWGGPQAKDSIAEDYAPALAELIKAQMPDMVLIRSTRRGKCIAGRLAVILGTSVCSDITSIEVKDGGEAQFLRRVYGGAAFRKARSTKKSPIALVGSGVFEAAPRQAAGSVFEMPMAPVSNGVTRVSTQAKQESTVDLNAAKRVVAVGRGVGSQENIAVVSEFAKAIEGEMACSRPIAEGEHWMPANRYIGISGAIIKPDVYIACGISGQVQHMVGVSDAKVVIAVNKDKSAPIFKNCDYGIVGDLNKVIPALTSRLKNNG